MADKILDLKGLACPLPVLKAKRALREIPAGGVLEIWATDPGAPDDFEALCRTSGLILLEISQTEEFYKVLIRKQP